MSQQPQLHKNIQNLVALGAAIASKCLKQAWLLEQELLKAGVPQYQIDQAVEIAAAMRDQAHANTVALFKAGPQALIDGIGQLDIDKSAPCDCEGDSCCTPADNTDEGCCESESSSCCSEEREVSSGCCGEDSAESTSCCGGDDDITTPKGCCG